MFPIMHYYGSKVVLENKLDTKDQTLILGGAFPDLAASMGLKRNPAHMLGKKLYNWCKQNKEESAIPFTLGAMIHGVDPNGIDYYSDEHWQGEEPGWCFQKVMPYLQQVKEICKVPKKWAAWKGHNLVEMACEHWANEKDPSLAEAIYQASENKEATHYCGEILNAYYKNAVSADIAQLRFNALPQVFSIEEVTFLSLAKFYRASLKYQHGITDVDVEALANLIAIIQKDIEDEIPEFCDIVCKKVKENLKAVSVI